MGRPREHDERIGQALLDAAERTIGAEGLEALSVRGVAEDVGTTTRAVYSLFGSKEGLVVALGARAWDLLAAAIDALPTTDDPTRDLVDAGAIVFRRLALEHPILFRIGVQRELTSGEAALQFDAARVHALEGLKARLVRLEETGLLGGRSLIDAACGFHALCEGLAALELRGALPRKRGERIWRDHLGALLAGFAAPARA